MAEDNLAATAPCPHQAFRKGPNLLGIQFHIETDPRQIEAWLIGHAVELAKAGRNPRTIRQDTSRKATSDRCRESYLPNGSIISKFKLFDASPNPLKARSLANIRCAVPMRIFIAHQSGTEMRDIVIGSAARAARKHVLFFRMSSCFPPLCH